VILSGETIKTGGIIGEAGMLAFMANTYDAVVQAGGAVYPSTTDDRV
jgi:NADPH-dependent glutamate synthase beta subunit-like oxidoreductase